MQPADKQPDRAYVAQSGVSLRDFAKFIRVTIGISVMIISCHCVLIIMEFIHVYSSFSVFCIELIGLENNWHEHLLCEVSLT